MMSSVTIESAASKVQTSQSLILFQNFVKLTFGFLGEERVSGEVKVGEVLCAATHQGAEQHLRGDVRRAEVQDGDHVGLGQQARQRSDLLSAAVNMRKIITVVNIFREMERVREGSGEREREKRKRDREKERLRERDRDK